MAIVGKILEILPGVLLAVILLEYFPPSSRVEALLEIVLSIATSIFSVLVVENLNLQKLVSKSDKHVKELISLVSKAGLNNNIVRYLVESGASEVNTEGFPTFYLDLLWSIRSSYFTTMLTSDRELGYGHNKLALEIQKTKVTVLGADIRRLFILANDQGLNTLFPLMKEQANNGIKVKYLLRSTINTNPALKEWAKKVKSLDFSILDEKFLLVTIISLRNFRISKALFSANVSERIMYQDFFLLLWAEGRAVSKAKARSVNILRGGAAKQK